MSNDYPETRSVKSEDVPPNWEQLVAEVAAGDRPILVERDGGPVAVLLSSHDFQDFRWMEQARQREGTWICQLWESLKDVPEDEFEREFEKALAEIREQNRRIEQAATGQ